MLAAFAPLGLDVAPEPAPVTAGSPLDAKLAFCAAMEGAYESVFEALCGGLAPVSPVSLTQPRRSPVSTETRSRSISIGPRT